MGSGKERPLQDQERRAVVLLAVASQPQTVGWDVRGAPRSVGSDGCRGSARKLVACAPPRPAGPRSCPRRPPRVRTSAIVPSQGPCRQPAGPRATSGATAGQRPASRDVPGMVHAWFDARKSEDVPTRCSADRCRAGWQAASGPREPTQPHHPHRAAHRPRPPPGHEGVVEAGSGLPHARPTGGNIRGWWRVSTCNT